MATPGLNSAIVEGLFRTALYCLPLVIGLVLIVLGIRVWKGRG